MQMVPARAGIKHRRKGYNPCIHVSSMLPKDAQAGDVQERASAAKSQINMAYRDRR